jgi:hypothetical protein
MRINKNMVIGGILVCIILWHLFFVSPQREGLVNQALLPVQTIIDTTEASAQIMVQKIITDITNLSVDNIAGMTGISGMTGITGYSISTFKQQLLGLITQNILKILNKTTLTNIEKMYQFSISIPNLYQQVGMMDIMFQTQNNNISNDLAIKNDQINNLIIPAINNIFKNSMGGVKNDFTRAINNINALITQQTITDKNIIYIMNQNTNTLTILNKLVQIQYYLKNN